MYDFDSPQETGTAARRGTANRPLTLHGPATCEQALRLDAVWRRSIFTCGRLGY
jgi:hypothetical protein